MKKLFLILLALLLSYVLVACNSNSQFDGQVNTFSYEEDIEYYKSNTTGVKTDGFKNTIESKITNANDAIEKAKNECTVEYDTIVVSFDDNAKIWRVNFNISTKNLLGGDQSVYLKDNGLTCYIVYGE